jgi:hypothetical protein
MASYIIGPGKEMAFPLVPGLPLFEVMGAGNAWGVQMRSAPGCVYYGAMIVPQTLTEQAAQQKMDALITQLDPQAIRMANF